MNNATVHSRCSLIADTHPPEEAAAGSSSSSNVRERGGGSVLQETD